MLEQFYKLSSKSYSFLTFLLDKIYLWRDLADLVLLCTVILKPAEHTLSYNVTFFFNQKSLPLLSFSISPFSYTTLKIEVTHLQQHSNIYFINVLVLANICCDGHLVSMGWIISTLFQNASDEESQRDTRKGVYFFNKPEAAPLLDVDLPWSLFRLHGLS